MYLIKGEQNQGLLSLSLSFTLSLSLSYLPFFYVWSQYPSLYIVLYMSSYLNKPNLFPCVGHLSYKWCGINILQSILSRVFFLLLSSFSVSMWITDNLSRRDRNFSIFSIFFEIFWSFFSWRREKSRFKSKKKQHCFWRRKKVTNNAIWVHNDNRVFTEIAIILNELSDV